MGSDISPRAMEFSKARIEGFLCGKGDIYQPGSQVSDDGVIGESGSRLYRRLTKQ